MRLIKVGDNMIPLIVIEDIYGNILSKNGINAGREQRAPLMHFIPNVGDEIAYKNFRDNERMFREGSDYKLKTIRGKVHKVIHEIQEGWNDTFIQTVRIIIVDGVITED